MAKPKEKKEKKKKKKKDPLEEVIEILTGYDEGVPKRDLQSLEED